MKFVFVLSKFTNCVVYLQRLAVARKPWFSWRFEQGAKNGSAGYERFNSMEKPPYECWYDLSRKAETSGKASAKTSRQMSNDFVIKLKTPKKAVISGSREYEVWSVQTKSYNRS